MSGVTLRGPQNEAIDAVRKAWLAGDRNALIVLPTGVGKSITALKILAGAVEKGMRVLYLAHQGELLEQPLRTLRALWPEAGKDAGIVKAERDDYKCRVVFGSVQTLRNDARLARYLSVGVPDLVVVDEAHHSVAAEWLKVLAAIDAARIAATVTPEKPGKASFKLGMTATPDRADGKSLAKIWKLVYSCSILRAIAEGFLVPPTCIADTLPVDLTSISGSGEDWDQEELGEALLSAHVVEHTVAAIQKHASDRRGFVFTANVAQARATSDALRAAGIEARFVSGETDMETRSRMIAAFRDQHVRWLVNCMVLTEGVDIPSADAVVMAAPTRARGRYMQRLGRGLRTNPSTGKTDCLVLDLVAATDEHGLVPITAPILLADLERREREQQERKANGTTGPGRAEAWRKGKPPEAAWVQVRGLDRNAWAVDCGEHGRVVVFEVEGGLWRAVLIGGRKKSDGSKLPDQVLCEAPVDFELAQGLGEDVARRASKLSRQAAGWRTKDASTKAIDLLLGFRHARGYARDVLPELLTEFFGTAKPTAGQVNDALTGEFVKRDLHKRGLARRTDRRGEAA